MGVRKRVGAQGAIAVITTGLMTTLAVWLVSGAAFASTNAVPKVMVGCWHRHVPRLSGLSAAGVWLVQIKSGELLAYTPGTKNCSQEPDFTATISVAGRHLTIGAVPVCGARGSYTWEATPRALTLAATADKTCAARRLLFTGVWHKQ